MNEPKWYVLRPTIHGDRRASEELMAADINHLMPTYKRFTLIKHTKGLRKETVMLLMPGYIFALLDANQVKTVNKHSEHFRHISHVFRAQGTDRALPVDPKAVEQLRYLCADGTFDQGKGIEGFADGDRVLIVGGPFDNLLATFKADGKVKDGFAKLVLDRMVFGKSLEVLVPEGLIQAA